MLSAFPSRLVACVLVIVAAGIVAAGCDIGSDSESDASARKLERALAEAHEETARAKRRAQDAAEIAEDLQAERDAKPEDLGDLKIVYDAPADDDEAAHDLVEGFEAFEQDIDALNEHLALPRDVAIRFASDVEGPQYAAWGNEITVPYWFVADTWALYKDADYADTEDDIDAFALDAMRFVLGHEIAHALIDQLHLPVLGKEEDAADAFAVVLAADVLKDSDMAITGGDFFDLSSAASETDELAAYWDSHSLDKQRFYTIQCLVYGADTKGNSAAIEGLDIDQDRIDECQFDWFDAKRSWETVLAPHELDD